MSVLDTCVDVFNREVENSDTLKNLFDLNHLRGLEVIRVAYDDFVAILTHLGIEDPKVIADLAARPMRNNFDIYKGEVTRKVYPSVVCNYAFTQGVLTQESAEHLGLQFSNFFEESAKEYVEEGDIASRFLAITQGITKFLDFIGPLNYERSLMLTFLFETEWLLGAIETQYSRDVFYKCSAEADGDPN
ncbi:uncharacterized protein NPIL_431791 [Nephila pilipes]|uniref:Uncharacterized protein n=1 Tax=Nephila pilipes TaxID=299642 RepID=A0A8X6IUK6_NEPPI|nr:uncharacterized protein NPIL_431791 [Nephila pilipes]